MQTRLNRGLGLPATRYRQIGSVMLSSEQCCLSPPTFDFTLEEQNGHRTVTYKQGKIGHLNKEIKLTINKQIAVGT